MFFDDTKLTETVCVSPGETIASVEVGVHVIMAGFAGRGGGAAEGDTGRGETVARRSTEQTSAKRTGITTTTARLRLGWLILSF
jgi:hypothetical protein